MRDERSALLRAAAKRVTPIILLVALYLAFRAEAGGGLAAGALAALAFVLNALLFGAAATLVAVPLAALRIAMAFGIAVLLIGLLLQAPNETAWRLAIELGLLVSVAASLALGFAAIAGRAHELRDGDW